MFRRLLFIVIFAFVTFELLSYVPSATKWTWKSSDSTAAPELKSPPVAKKVPEVIRIRNVTIQDDYKWLKNLDSDPDVRKYIQEENAFTDAWLWRTRSLQDTLGHEIDGWTEKKLKGKRYNIDQIWEWGSHVYYTVHEKGKAHPQYYRRVLSTTESCRPSLIPGTDELVLDYNAFIPQNASYFAVGIFEVSPAEDLIAHSFDLVGNEKFSLRIVGLHSKKEVHLPEVTTYYSARWLMDSKTNETSLFFNTVDDKYGIPRSIHKICVRDCSKFGVVEDIFKESDISITVELKSTSDNKFIFIKVEWFDMKLCMNVLIAFINILVRWSSHGRIPISIGSTTTFTETSTRSLL